MMSSYPNNFSTTLNYKNHPAFAPYTDLVFSDSDVSLEIERVNRGIEEAKISIASSEGDSLSIFQELVAVPVTRLFQTINREIKISPRIHQFLDVLKERIVDALCSDIGYAYRQGKYQPNILSHAELCQTLEFEEKGFFKRQIDGSLVKELSKLLSPYRQAIRDRYRQGKTSREFLSVNQIDRQAVSILGQILNHYRIPQSISNARQEPIQVGGFALELSVPESVWWRSRYRDLNCESKKTAYYHTDEAPDIMKAILYLSDVDEDSGPFTVVPESYFWPRPPLAWVAARVADAIGELMKYDDLPDRQLGLDTHLFASSLGRKHFLSLPVELQNVSHFGNDILPGSELEKTLVKRCSPITGEAGTIVAFDGGRIVHRGGLVERGERWACQIIFGCDQTMTNNLKARWKTANMELSSKELASNVIVI